MEQLIYDLGGTRHIVVSVGRTEIINPDDLGKKVNKAILKYECIIVHFEYQNIKVLVPFKNVQFFQYDVFFKNED